MGLIAMKNRVYLYIKAFSDLGSRMDMIVLGALIYGSTHSVGWLSASLLAGIAGGLVSSLLSGVLADKADRRKIMVFSDILRALLIVLLIPFPDPVMIVIVRFLIGFINSFFEVSFSAEIPQIYGQDKALEINSLLSRLSSVSMVAGFLGGGLLSDWIGYQAVLVFDSLSFLTSAAVLLSLRWTATPVVQRVKSGSTTRSFLHDLQEVRGYLWLQPSLLLVFSVYLMDTFGSGSHNLGIPLLAANIDPLRQAYFYGIIWSVWAAGNVLATYLIPKVKWIGGNLQIACFTTVVMMSLGFISIFMSTNLPMMLFCAFVTGVFDAVAVTSYATMMQQCDNHIRGRVIGISTLTNKLGFAVGFIVAPLLLEKLSLPQMVAVLHGTVILAAVTALLIYLRAFRKPLAPVPVPVPEQVESI